MTAKEKILFGVWKKERAGDINSEEAGRLIKLVDLIDDTDDNVGIDLTFCKDILPLFIQFITLVVPLMTNCPKNSGVIKRVTVAALKELDKASSEVDRNVDIPK